MESLPSGGSAPATLLPALPAKPILAWRKLFRRPRRVLAMLIILWLLNVFDLLFTLRAHELGSFLEVNPVARIFLATDLLNNLVAYKLILCLFGSLLLYRVRFHPFSEYGCMVGLVVYGYVSLLWLRYFQWAATHHPIAIFDTPVLPY